MTQVFRDFIRKIGSGPHTSKSLTQAEAQTAMAMMLRQEATPAQIGAFFIAHRIKRPTGEELAGMLDAYDQLGTQVPAVAGPAVMVLGCPYDGRSRTAPVTPLTALLLAAAGQPVLLHGGDSMPTKYGVPLVTLWQQLGLDWRGVSLETLAQTLVTAGVAFVYQPHHFPAATALTPYREEIGKRPPIATLELLWCPYRGAVHQVAGFVHPPTELMMREAWQRRGGTRLTTVKGLEGSCDIPRDRPVIVGIHRGEAPQLERVTFRAYPYGYGGPDPAMDSLTPAAMVAALQGEDTPLATSLRWNGGFYLWLCGQAPDLEAGLALATTLVQQGKAWEQLLHLRQTLEVLQEIPNPLGELP